MKKINIINGIKEAALPANLTKMKTRLQKLIREIENTPGKKSDSISYQFNNENLLINKHYLLGELQQIIETKTLKRADYYLNRLLKSLSEEKTGKINDLNLNRWKEYDDIITDSLWVLDKRDKSGAHKGSYWGNFIPQIPNQFLRRYTKRDEWILDPFTGSGTSLIECKRLGRNGFGVDINPEAVKTTKGNLAKEKNPFNIKAKVITGDSSSIDYKSKLKKLKSTVGKFT